MKLNQILMEVIENRFLIDGQRLQYFTTVTLGNNE